MREAQNKWHKWKDHSSGNRKHKIIQGIEIQIDCEVREI